MRPLIALLTFALALAWPAPATASSHSDLLALINGYRARLGLVSLVPSPALGASAQWMASDMAAQNYFPCCHVSLDGRTAKQRMTDAGYPTASTIVGEAIAVGTATPAATLAIWQGSAPHNALLTDARYRAVGIGAAYSAGSTYKWYWVANFGGLSDGGAAARSLAPAPLRPAPLPRAVVPARPVPRDPQDQGFHAAFVEQRVPAALPPGESGVIAIAYRNTGSRAWTRGSPGEARLGLNAPLDAGSALALEWPAPDRPAAQDAERVPPGAVGWFTFRVRAPEAPGTYLLRVRPVVDGAAWLEDEGAYFEFRVVLVPLLEAR